MTKRELDILEKAFSAQISGGLYHGKCKVTKKLAEDGYLVFEERTLGRDCLGLIKVSGYSVTHIGVYTYSTSERCSDEAIAKLEAEDGEQDILK